MIPDIIELNFPKKDGKQYATLTQATANIADMGEKTITTQVKIDGEIVPDFSFDWAVEFQGEKYIMPLRIPQGAKGNDSLNSTIDLTFQHWAIYQLKRWPFVTIQQIAAGTYLPDEEVATVQLNLKDFCILFGQVLEYYYGGAITIDFNDDPVTGWQYKQEATIITISHTKIWNVLIDAFHDKYGVRWEIKPTAENSNTVKGGERYVIRVGYPTTEVDHIFEYGFEGGLLKVERQVQSEEIRNMLKGRGGETNIPFRYFKNTDRNNKDFRPDPDWVEELANIYFPNLMPATFRSYIQGWKAAHINQTDADGKKIYAGYKAVGESNAYAPWAYRKGYTDTKFSPVEFVADEITVNPAAGDKQVEILPGYSPYVKKGSSIDKYGPLPDTLDNNDDIYPTLQGTGLDIAVDVEQIESDDVAESTESDAQLIKIPGSSVSSTAVNVAPSSFATIKLPRVNFSVLPGKHGNLIVNVEVLSAVHNGKQIEILNNAEKQGSETINVYNTITGEKRSASGIPEGSYYFEVEVSVHNMTTDKTLNISAGTTTVKLQDATLTDDKWRNTFDIWVKNIWDSTRRSGETDAQYSERVWKPVLGDREGNKAKVVFTSGDLALSEDYEFTIVDFPAPDASKTWKEKDSDGNITATHTSHWRIKLAKSDAELEATGLYVPSKQKQGKAGDTFVFIGTEMTHVPYVVDAEKRLDDWKKDRLGEVNEIKPTAVVTTDRVRLNNEGKPDALINQLRVGNSLRLFDKRFFNEEGKAYETLYLQSITYTYREPSSDDAALNPDVEIVLGNEYTTSANPVSMMQGEISALQRQLGSISNTEQIVRAVGDKLYLRKDGISDRSLSPTQFFSLLTSGDFRAGLVGGAGWGFFKDENGNWVLETDRIKARQDLEVNNLVINQVEGRGGMQVDTAAFMEVTRVAETSDGYVCYFDQKNGTVANLFHVDDVAMSMVFNEEWDADSALVKTYKRRVVAVAENSVTLSKTESNGSGIPMAGDVIVHYGNYTDATRQYVKVRDVVGGGYERYIEGLNSVNADGVEYYFVGRQSGMYNGRPRFYIGDDNGYVEWLNGELNIKGRLSLQSSIGDTNIGTYINKAAQSAADAAKAELQKQIDGVIEAFNGMGAPTLSNHPAIEWTTDAERKRHDKDVYTDITPYVDNATTPTSGQSWRWYYNSPTDYGWTKIADSDAVRALQLAHMSVRNADVLYISHISQTSAPVLPALGADGTINDYKGWQTNAPAWSATKYIWQTTYVRRGDGKASFSTPTCISGRNGTDGASVTVTSTEVRYSTVHDSASQPADLTFTLTEVPSLKAGQYLWSRTTVTYSTGGQTQTYAVSRMGCDGASYSANMLLNSMFDSPAHWWFKNASTIDTGRKRDGRNSVKIPATGLTTNYWEGVGQTVECEAGVEVTGSIWSLVEDFSTFDSAFSMELTCLDATGNRISGGSKYVSIMPDKAGEWQQFSASMTTVEGTAKVQLYVFVTRNGVAWANSPKLEIGSNPDPVWSPAAAEMTAPRITEQYYLSESSTSLTGGAWSDTRQPWEAGRYYWTRSKITYGDGTVEYTDAVCVTGTPGKDALILSLSNEMAGVACDAEGNVTGAYPTSQASVYKGATLLTSGVAYSIPQKTGITTANISASGAVTMSGMTADTAEITVRAVVSGVTLDTVLSLYKVKPGANGQAAVAYSIEPSADKVTRSMAGALSATSVTCSVYKSTGNTARVLSNDHTLTYLRLPDGAGGTLARTNGTSGAVQILADTEAVVFELKDGNTLLDRERVAVFADASDLEVGGRNFARMTANEWTAPASVFNNGINNVALAYHCYGLKSGDLVTVSFDYEASGLTFGSRSRIKMQSSKAYGFEPGLPLMASNGRGHAKKTATVGGTSATETSDGEMSFRFDNVTASSEGYFKVWNFKIEKGNIETSWTAAPDDSDYLRNAIVQARRSLTEIDGGLILTSLIRLGMFNQSGEGKVMSGISGICDRETSPAIWIGGDMVDRFDNPQGLTPAAGMFRHNGLGYLSNGLIRFLADAIEIGPPDGTREKAIRFDQHGMKMFADSDGSMRMIITNKPLDYDAVDAVQGDVTTIPLPTGRIASMYDIFPPATAADGSIRLGSCVIHGYGALTSALGRLPANSEISVPITVNLGYTITTDLTNYTYSGYIRVRIFSRSMVIFDRTANIDPQRGEGSMTVNATTPVAGPYTLEVTIGNTLPDYSGMEGNEATVTGIDSGKITKGSANLMEIGANGMLIVRGEMKALFCDNYFGVKVGSNFGIQITPNSATMRLSGSQWRTLSRASDGTLKLN